MHLSWETYFGLCRCVHLGEWEGEGENTLQNVLPNGKLYINQRSLLWTLEVALNSRWKSVTTAKKETVQWSTLKPGFQDAIVTNGPWVCVDSHCASAAWMRSWVTFLTLSIIRLCWSIRIGSEMNWIRSVPSTCKRQESFIPNVVVKGIYWKLRMPLTIC